MGFYLKKINAAAAFLVILSLLGHAGTMTFSLWTGWYNFMIAKTFAYVTAGALALHVLISLIIFFFFHDGASLKYKKENKTVIIQRATALLILILLHVHITAYSHMATGETLTVVQTIFYCISESLFFISVASHAAVSVSKGMITLGLISSPKTVRAVDIISYSLCAFIMLAATGGMLSFFIGG